MPGLLPGAGEGEHSPEIHEGFSKGRRSPTPSLQAGWARPHYFTGADPYRREGYQVGWG